MARSNIENLIARGDQLIKALAEPIIVEAQTDANQQLSAEINRLQALRTVNKNIRQSEIDILEAKRTQSLDELAKANWRLDCLRVIVTNKE